MASFFDDPFKNPADTAEDQFSTPLRDPLTGPIDAIRAVPRPDDPLRPDADPFDSMQSLDSFTSSLDTMMARQERGPRFESPYDGMDLLSEPKDQTLGPTAFQRKEINWSDGWKRDPNSTEAPVDFLEVDPGFGKKDGANLNPVTSANVFGRSFSAMELSQDEEGRKLLDLMRVRRSGEQNSGGMLANFGRGLVDWSVSDIPYYGWISDIGVTAGEAVTVSKTIRKMQNGERVTPHEEIMARRVMLQQEMSSQRTMAYNVGSVVRQAVPFMAEMAMDAAVGAAVVGGIAGGASAGLAAIPGAAVGAVGGALVAPVKMLFRLLRGGTVAAARKVVSREMQALARKATRDLVEADMRSVLQASTRKLGRIGTSELYRATRREVMKDMSGLSRTELRQEIYHRMADRMAYQTLGGETRHAYAAVKGFMSGDHLNALNAGIEKTVEDRILRAALGSVDDISKLSARERAAHITEFLRKNPGYFRGNDWKTFRKSLADGLIDGLNADGTASTAAGFVQRMATDSTGQFVSRGYGKAMADVATQNAIRNVELKYGAGGPFGGFERFGRWMKEHAVNALLRSEHPILSGGSPTVAHGGLASFNTARDAISEGLGRVFVEAPVMGAMQMAVQAPMTMAVAAATGVNPADVVVKGQLGFETNALLTGDRKSMDSARMCAIGSMFAEFMSENAGRGLGLLVGAPALAATNLARRAFGVGAEKIASATGRTSARKVVTDLTPSMFATAARETFVDPITRKGGALLDKAVSAVFGHGDLRKLGTDRLVGLAERWASGRGLSGVTRAELRNVLSTMNFKSASDGFVAAMRDAGIRSASQLRRAVVSEVENMGRFQAARACIGAELMRRGLTPDEIVRKFRQMGRGGTLEEMGEERLGDFVRGLFKLDDSASDADISDRLKRMFSGFTDPEQLATEFIGFAIPGMVRTAAISSQRWLASGAVSDARASAVRLGNLRTLIRNGVPVFIHNVRDERTRDAVVEHERMMAEERDRVLGRTDDNRAAFSAEAERAFSRRDSLRSEVEAAGGLPMTAEQTAAGTNWADTKAGGRLSGVLAATSVEHMAKQMEEFADGIVSSSATEAELEKNIRDSGAEVVLGSAGVDAVRKEWRKIPGHAFSDASNPIESGMAGYERMAAERPTRPAYSAATAEDGVAEAILQHPIFGENRSPTAEQEARARAGSDTGAAPIVNEDVLDVATDDMVNLGRYIGRAEFANIDGMSGTRKFISKAVGFLAAMSTGDLSLAAADPAMWIAQDEGLDRNMLLLSLTAYTKGIEHGYAVYRSRQTDEVKERLDRALRERGNVRQAIRDLRLDAPALEEIERLGEEKYRESVRSVMSQYLTTCGIMMIGKDQADSLARSIVYNRHVKAGDRLGEGWEATLDADAALAGEVSAARAEVDDALVAMAEGAMSYRQRGSESVSNMTVDVMRAVRAGSSEEALAAILSTDQFKSVYRMVDISGCSELECQKALSAASCQTADLQRVLSIDETAEEISEKDIVEVSGIMGHDFSTHTAKENQDAVREFVQRVRLSVEGGLTEYEDAASGTRRATVVPVSSDGGRSFLVRIFDGDAVVEETAFGSMRDANEYLSGPAGFTARTRQLIVSPYRDIVSTDATSLILFRSGNDRTEARAAYIRELGDLLHEDQLPPLLRSAGTKEDGTEDWLIPDAAKAAEQTSRELALAREFELYGTDFARYAPMDTTVDGGTVATSASDDMADYRRNHMEQARKAFDRVMGRTDAMRGYEKTAAKMLTDAGCRQQFATGNEYLADSGVKPNAWVMPISSVMTSDAVILSPDYSTDGQTEILLRVGLMNGILSYLRSDGDGSRAELLAAAAKEFRRCAYDLQRELKDRDPRAAKRVVEAVNSALGDSELSVNAYNFASMASAVVFFSGERGIADAGNGFRYGPELARIADRFRGTRMFPVLYSAVDEALGGTGLFRRSGEPGSAGGVARYMKAFAQNATKILNARKSAMFSAGDGSVGNPLMMRYALRPGTTADNIAPGCVSYAEGDALEDRRFDGSVDGGGYAKRVAEGCVEFATAYLEAVGDASRGRVPATEVFRLVRADVSGGEASAESAASGGASAGPRPFTKDPALRAMQNLMSVADTKGIDRQSALVIGGSMKRMWLVSTDLRGADFASVRETERSFRSRMRGFLVSMNVPEDVILDIMSGYDDATFTTIADATRRKADGGAAVGDEETDLNGDRADAAFIEDETTATVWKAVKWLYPSNQGVSSVFCHVRDDVSRLLTDEAVDGLDGLDGDRKALVKWFARSVNPMRRIRDGYNDALAADLFTLPVDRGATVDRAVDAAIRALGDLGCTAHAMCLSAIRNLPSPEVRRKFLLQMAHSRPLAVGQVVVSRRDGETVGLRQFIREDSKTAAAVGSVYAAHVRRLGLQSKTPKGVADALVAELGRTRQVRERSASGAYEYKSSAIDVAARHLNAVKEATTHAFVNAGATVHVAVHGTAEENRRLYETVSSVVDSGDRGPVTAEQWYDAVDAMTKVVRERAAKAADAVDEIFGAGSELAAVLRAPFTFAGASTSAKDAFYSKDVEDRRTYAWRLVQLANYFSRTEGSLTGTTNMKQGLFQLSRTSQFLSDVYVEPVRGLCIALGAEADEVMDFGRKWDRERIAAKLAANAKLQNDALRRAAGGSAGANPIVSWIGQKLADLAGTKLKHGMPLDHGRNAREIAETLGVSRAFDETRAPVRPNLGYVFDSYLMSSPKASQTLGGRAADMKEAAKNRATTTPVSALPAIERAMNGWIMELGGAAEELLTNDMHWDDGTSPVVAIVGAKRDGVLLDKKDLASLTLNGAINGAVGERRAPTHIYVPLFRADKPAMYAFAMPVRVAKAWLEEFRRNGRLSADLPMKAKAIVDAATRTGSPAEAAAADAPVPTWTIDLDGPHHEKDQRKFNQLGGITKFVGFGATGSSTEYYRMNTFASIANTGSYSGTDVVGVSVNGAVPGRVDVMDPRYKAELKLALDAGATIVADDRDYRDKSTYNVGEKRLADALSQSGYVEIDGSGVWVPAAGTDRGAARGRAFADNGAVDDTETRLEAERNGERTRRTNEYLADAALVSVALGQAMIDTKRVPTMLAQGPDLAAYRANDDGTIDPLAGLYVVSTLSGTTAASMTGSYHLCGVLADRVASLSPGGRAVTQKLHVIGNTDNVNQKKGQGFAFGLAVSRYSDETPALDGYRYQQDIMLETAAEALGVDAATLRDPGEKPDSMSDQDYRELVAAHEEAVKRLNRFLSVSTIMTDDNETNKAGLFSGRAGFSTYRADGTPVQEVTVLGKQILVRGEDGEWTIGKDVPGSARVDVLDEIKDGPENGCAPLALTMYLAALAVGKDVSESDMSSISAAWRLPDGRVFDGEFGKSGLVRDGDALKFAVKGPNEVRMVYRTRSMIGKIVANNSSSSRPESDHLFPTNATRDEEMLELLTSEFVARSGGRQKSNTRFLDVHTSYTALQLMRAYGDVKGLLDALDSDEELRSLAVEHPNSPAVRDAISRKVRTYTGKRAIVGFFGTHGVMSPSSGNGHVLQEIDRGGGWTARFTHLAAIEDTPGTTAYDRDLLAPASIYGEAKRRLFGRSRGWAHGLVNTRSRTFRYRWYFDTEKLGELLRGPFGGGTYAHGSSALRGDAAFNAEVKRLAGVFGADWADTLARLRRVLEYARTDNDAKRALARCCTDYTGESADRIWNFDTLSLQDLWYTDRDGNEAFDYTALVTASGRDGKRHICLDGSFFIAHRSPSGNVQAYAGVVRATAPVTFNNRPDEDGSPVRSFGRPGGTSIYTLDGATMYTQGSDTDGDSAGCQVREDIDESIPRPVLRDFMNRLSGGVVSRRSVYDRETGETRSVPVVTSWTPEQIRQAAVGCGLLKESDEGVPMRIFSILAQMVFDSQVDNAREAETVHQGWLPEELRAALIAQRAAKGADYAGGFADDVFHGYEFADLLDSPEGRRFTKDGRYRLVDVGWTGRQPVGADPIFEEPVNAGNKAKIMSLLSRHAAELVARSDAFGKHDLSSAFKTLVKKCTPDGKANLVTAREAARSSDAAADAFVARGSSVAIQSRILRMFARSLGGEFGIPMVMPDGYSPMADLIGHLDGIANNLFDVLKEMFGTRAGWEADIVQLLYARCAFHASRRLAADGGFRLDNAFFFAELANFFAELDDGDSALSRYRSFVDQTGGAEALREAFSIGEDRAVSLSDAVTACGRTVDSQQTDADGNPVKLSRTWSGRKYSLNRKIADLVRVLTGPGEADDLVTAVSVVDLASSIAGGIDYVVGAGRSESGARVAAGRTDSALAAVENSGAGSLAGVYDGSNPATSQLGVMRTMMSLEASLSDSFEAFESRLGSLKSVCTSFAEGKTPATAPDIRRLTRRWIGRAAAETAAGTFSADTARGFLQKAGDYEALADLLPDAWNDYDRSLFDRAVEATMLRKNSYSAFGSAAGDALRDNFERLHHLLPAAHLIGPALASVGAVDAGEFARRLGLFVSSASMKASSNMGRGSSVASRLLARLGVRGASDLEIVLSSPSRSKSEVDVLRRWYGRMQNSDEVFSATIDVGNGEKSEIRMTGAALANALYVYAAATRPFDVGVDYVGSSSLSSMFDESVIDAYEKESRPLVMRHPAVMLMALRGQESVNGTPGRGVHIYNFASQAALGFFKLYAQQRSAITRDFARTRGEAFAEIFADRVRGENRVEDNVVEAVGLTGGNGSIRSVSKVPTSPGDAKVRDFIGVPLESRTEFSVSGTEEFLGFPIPAIDEKGNLTMPRRREDWAYRPTPEEAFNEYLRDRSEWIEADDGRSEDAKMSYAMNGRPKITPTGGETEFALKRILLEAARASAAFADTLRAGGEKAIVDERWSPAMTRAVNAVRRQAVAGTLERTKRGARADFSGGNARGRGSADVTRRSFMERLGDLFPDIDPAAVREQMAKTMPENIKKAMEAAIPNCVVERVGESNLLRMTRTVKTRRGDRKVVTYISYGDFIAGDGGAAYQESVLEMVNRSRAELGRPALTMDELKRNCGGNLDAVVRELAKNGNVTGLSEPGSDMSFAPAMSGLIRLDAGAGMRTLFHEYYHQMVACFSRIGALTDADVSTLNSEFRDEEEAADAYARYITGIEGYGDDVSIAGFLSDGGDRAKSMAVFRHMRRTAARIAVAMARPSGDRTYADVDPVFERVRVFTGDLGESSLGELDPGALESVENMLLDRPGDFSRPTLDETDMSRYAKVLEALEALKGDSPETAAGILAGMPSETPPSVGGRERPRTPGNERRRPAAPVPADVVGMRAFLKAALSEYAHTPAVDLAADEVLRVYRASRLDGSDASSASAAVSTVYTIRRLLRYIAQAEGIRVEDEYGNLTETGRALLMNEELMSLAYQYLLVSTNARGGDEDGEEAALRATVASADYAFARALETVRPESYRSFALAEAKRASDNLKSLRAGVVAKIRAERERGAGEESLAELKSRAARLGEMARDVLVIAQAVADGEDLHHLVPGTNLNAGSLHGLLFRMFTGGATMLRALGEEIPGHRTSRKGPRVHNQTGSLVYEGGDLPLPADEPLMRSALDFAARAFFVAESARSFRQRIGEDADVEALERIEREFEGYGEETPESVSGGEKDAVAARIAETLGEGGESFSDFGRVDSAKWYGTVELDSKTPEWLLANEETWVSGDMQRNLSGAGMRELLTDHSIRAACESKMRFAADFTQFLGLDLYLGDRLKKMEFKTSLLGRNEDGDFAVGEEHSHTTMDFARTRGYLFGIFNLDAKRVGDAFTAEETRMVHYAAQMVAHLANGDREAITGIEIRNVGTSEVINAVRAARDSGDFSAFSPAAVIERVDSGRGTALDEILAMVMQDLPKLVAHGTDTDVPWKDMDDFGSLGGRGVYARVVRAMADGVAGVDAKVAEVGPAKVTGAMTNDIFVDALAEAGLATRSAKRHGRDARNVSVRLADVSALWRNCSAWNKLVAAGRPSDMLSLHYWASRFARETGELTRTAAKSSYLKSGTGTMFTLSGATQMWWVAGHGSRAESLHEHQEFLKSVNGMRPSANDVLERRNRSLSDVLLMIDQKKLHRPAFTSDGKMNVTMAQVDSLREVLGIDDAPGAKQFAAKAATGVFERRGVPLPADATVLDVCNIIAERLSRAAHDKIVKGAGLPTQEKQDAFDQINYAERILARLNQEVPGQITARGDAYMFKVHGLLGSSMTAAERLVHMCNEITAAERFRGVLGQMLTSVAFDGSPNFVVDPTEWMAETNGFPDEYWGALARHVIAHSQRLVGVPHNDASGRSRTLPEYDAGVSGVENMRRVYRALLEANTVRDGNNRTVSRLYHPLDVGKANANAMFHGILCRNDGRDSAGNTSVLTSLQGGEAEGYMRQLLALVARPVPSCGWKILDSITSWSKLSSVGWSAFFQIATAIESPTAAVGLWHTLMGQSKATAKMARAIGRRLGRTGGSGAFVADAPFLADLLEHVNSDDRMMTEARELCDLVGIPLDNSVPFANNDAEDSNPVLGSLGTVAKDIEFLSRFASKTDRRFGASVRRMLNFMYRHPTDYTFNVVLNGVKLVVVMETMRRLREECRRGNRPFDPIAELKKHAAYINAEIGGIDPARYAWATPQMRKILSMSMFSWQWTVGAWVAGSGEAVTDALFGGHSTTRASRQVAWIRWLRMLGTVKFGIPVVLQLGIKALSTAIKRALPPDPDDPEDTLGQEIENMPWLAFNNESKAGALAFDVTPILKLARRVPGATALKRYEIGFGEKLGVGAVVGTAAALATRSPLSGLLYGAVAGSALPVVTSLVPAYVGGGRNTTGQRRYYMHFGKQSDEFFRWFEDPLSQAIAKTSIPMQKIFEGVFGRLQPNGYSKAFADKSLFERWFNLDLTNPDESALANFLWMFTSFSFQSMADNADAGVLAAVGPMRMGQSKRSTRLRIVERLNDFVEDDRPGNPWSARRNRRKLNLLCTDILREAQLNGVDPADIMTSAIGDLAKAQYIKLMSALPKDIRDNRIDTRTAQAAVRGLTRLNRKYADIMNSVVERYQDRGVDVARSPQFRGALRELLRATQNSPFLYSSDAAEESYRRWMSMPDAFTRSTSMAANGGEGFSNFLATDQVPETLFGVPVVVADHTIDDLEFFAEHPEAGGYYDLGDQGETA